MPPKKPQQPPQAAAARAVSASSTPTLTPKRDNSHDFGAVRALVSALPQSRERVVWCALRESGIKVVNAESGLTVGNARGNATVLTLSRDGLLVWAGCADGSIHIYDVESTRLVHDIQGHSGAVNALCVTERGVWSGSTDFGLKLWDIVGGRVVQHRTLQLHRHWVSSIVCARDGRMWSGGEHTLLVWDEATGRPLKELTDSGTVQSLVSVEDTVWAGSSTGHIKIFDATSFNCLRELHGHSGPATALLYVNELVFSASGDASVRVWEAKTGQPLFILRGHNGWVGSMCLVGDLIWTASADRHVHVWSTSVGGLEGIGSPAPENFAATLREPPHGGAASSDAGALDLALSGHSAAAASGGAASAAAGGSGTPGHPSPKRVTTTAKSIVGLEKQVAELKWKLDAEARARQESQRARALAEDELRQAERRYQEQLAKCSELDRANKRLAAELQRLREGAKRKFGTENEYGDKLTALQSEVEHLRQRGASDSELQTALQSAYAENATLRESCREKDGRIEALEIEQHAWEARKTEWEGERERLRKDVEVALAGRVSPGGSSGGDALQQQQQIGALQSRIRELELAAERSQVSEEMQALRAAHAKLQRRMAALEEQLRAEQNTSAQLERERNTLASTNADLQSRFERSERSIEELMKELERANERLRFKRDDNNALSDMRLDLDRSQRAALDLQRTCDDLTAERDSLMAALKDLEDEARNNRVLLDERDDEITTLSRELDQLARAQVSTGALHEECERLRADLAASEARQRETERLSEQLQESYQSQFQMLHDSIVELQRERDELRVQLSQGNLREQVEQLNAQLRHANDQVEDLSRELLSSKHTTSRSGGGGGALSPERESVLLSKLELLNRRVRALTSDLEQSSRERDDALRRAERLESQVGALQRGASPVSPTAAFARYATGSLTKASTGLNGAAGGGDLGDGAAAGERVDASSLSHSFVSVSQHSERLNESQASGRRGASDETLRRVVQERDTLLKSLEQESSAKTTLRRLVQHIKQYYHDAPPSDDREGAAASASVAARTGERLAVSVREAASVASSSSDTSTLQQLRQRIEEEMERLKEMLESPYLTKQTAKHLHEIFD